MASPDEICKIPVDADHRCYNTVELTPRIWPPTMLKSSEQHTYSFRDNAELAILYVVVRNGSVNAIYLEHIRVVENSPFTEGAFEKLRLSIPVKLENFQRKMRDMRSFTLQEIYVGMEMEEQQRRYVQRYLRSLETHKDAKRTSDDEPSKAKREKRPKKEERQWINLRRCLHLLKAQQNVSTAQENDDCPRENDIVMSMSEYERMEAAEKSRCDAMCADLIG